MKRSPFRDETAEYADYADEVEARDDLPYEIASLDGETVYRVPLENRPGVYATLDAAALDILTVLGITFLIGKEMGSKHTYVFAQPDGVRFHWESVARLLARPAPGQWVRYANGDRTDLRRSNLVLFTPNARSKSAAAS